MNRIAFVNLEGQLETIASDGTHRQQLTDDDLYYQFPAWSPDGKSLAAVGSRQKEGVIVVGDPEDSESNFQTVYRSTTQQPFYLYWSPNGRRLAFLATHARAGIGLYTISALGGPSQFLGVGQPLFLDWQGSGDEILVHAGGANKDPRLVFINLTDLRSVYEMETIADPGFFQAPGFSPSGRYFAYAGIDPDGQSNLIVEQVKNRKRFRFRHHGATIVSWNPMADLLATTSPPEHAQHFYGPLRLLDPNSARLRTLTRETVLAFFWSPNGRWIAYLTVAQTSRIGQSEIIEEGYARGRKLPDEVNFNLWLNLSAVNIYTGARRLLTPFKPNSLFVNQLMPFFDQYALSHRLWSPHSDGLVLPAMIGASETIVFIPLNGLPPVPLAPGMMASWSPR